jgi:hypothetical protein
MASNQVPQTPDALISLAADAQNGAINHGTDIGLSHNTAADITADLIAFIGDPGVSPPLPGTRNIYNSAKSAKTAATARRRSVESNGRAFCASAVGLLKNFLGNQWNSQWQAAGFTTGSLAIPDDTLPMLGELRGFFSANPARENAPLGITAAACTGHLTAISEVRAAVNQSVLDLGIAKANNETACNKLYSRITGLRSELTQLLPDDDPRWYAFGFDRPADGWGPSPVFHLVLTAGGTGMVFADWDDARRADRYRIFKQIPGTDPQPVEVSGTVTESEYTLVGLPTGAIVQITVCGVNDAGDGPLSEMASIVVP